jgi:hypothetical protein
VVHADLLLLCLAIAPRRCFHCSRASWCVHNARLSLSLKLYGSFAGYLWGWLLGLVNAPSGSTSVSLCCQIGVSRNSNRLLTYYSPEIF